MAPVYLSKGKPYRAGPKAAEAGPKRTPVSSAVFSALGPALQGFAAESPRDGTSAHLFAVYPHGPIWGCLGIAYFKALFASTETCLEGHLGIIPRSPTYERHYHLILIC